MFFCFGMFIRVFLMYDFSRISKLCKKGLLLFFMILISLVFAAPSWFQLQYSILENKNAIATIYQLDTSVWNYLKIVNLISNNDWLNLVGCVVYLEYLMTFTNVIADQAIRYTHTNTYFILFIISPNE